VSAGPASGQPAGAPRITLTVGGTGTSTLCRLLQQRLGLPYTYAGALFREEAARRGLTLAEFGALSQKDPSIDAALDDRQIFLLRKGGLILEGRLSGWLAQRHRINAVKVWVTCNEAERIRRIVDRDGGTVQDQADATWAREQSEADRYRRYYGADLNDLAFYDLVLDSTHQLPNALADQVVAAVEAVQRHAAAHHDAKA
jgi:predicted cytidylate kinase